MLPCSLVPRLPPPEPGYEASYRGNGPESESFQKSHANMFVFIKLDYKNELYTVLWSFWLYTYYIITRSERANIIIVLGTKIINISYHSILTHTVPIPPSLIGASRSKPHINELNVRNPYIIIYYGTSVICTVAPRKKTLHATCKGAASARRQQKLMLRDDSSINKVSLFLNRLKTIGIGGFKGERERALRASTIRVDLTLVEETEL